MYFAVMKKDAVVKNITHTLNKVNKLDFQYAIIICISLVLQFGTIVYYSYMRSFLATIVAIVDLGMWGAFWIYYSNKKNILFNQLKIVLPIVLLAMIIAVRILFASGYEKEHSPVRALYHMYSIVYAILIGCSAKTLPKVLQKKILFVFYLICFLTVLPSYFYVLFVSKDAIRDEAQLYGIIDFQYIYSVIPLIGITLSMLLHAKVKGRIKIVMWLMVISNTGIILLSNFATAIGMLLIAVFLAVIYRKKQSLGKFSIVIICFVGLIFLCRGLLVDLCIWLSKQTDVFSIVMIHRIQDIAQLLSGDGFGPAFSERIYLMNNSWNSFLRGPIFGVDYNGLRGYLDLGYHETWVTLLAYSGVVGLILVLTTFFLYFKVIRKRIKNKYFKNIYFLMLAPVFILSFFNPIFSKSVMLIPLLVMPMMESISNTNNNY